MFFPDFMLSKMSRYATALLLSTALLTACGDDDSDDQPPVPVPPAATATGNYTFERNGSSSVDYSGQQSRIAMLVEIVDEIKLAHDPAFPGNLDAAKLKDMYANTGNRFQNSDLNNAGKNIRSKTAANRIAYYESLFDTAQLASMSNVAAAEGQPGVLQRGSSMILLDANGNELLQLVEKGLFIESFYFQATEYYLSAAKLQAAMNQNLKNGKNYSDMEHHWDESFGYTGFNNEYAQSTGLMHNAKYIMSRNDIGYEIGRRIHNAYELGRRNISEQYGKPLGEEKYAVRDAQINIIKSEWETALAATAVSYLNKAQEKISAVSGPDLAEKLHVLSEAKAFMNVMRYSDRFTAIEAQSIMDMIGDNNYDVTSQNIINAKTAIAAKYNSFDKDFK